MTNVSPTTIPRKRQAAYTLFEVLLSLTLILALMTLIGTAINTHLRNQFHNRLQVEEAQLARALLHRIAEDIRAVVLDPETDEETATTEESETDGDSSGDTSSDTSSTTDEEASYEDYYYYEEEVIGTKKGIYGGLDWIQIDTMRTIPGERFTYDSDDYAYTYEDEDRQEYLSEIDLFECGQKTVLYYLGADSRTTDSDEEYLKSQKKTSVEPDRYKNEWTTSNVKYGLYYREMNRMITQYAVDNGLDAASSMAGYDEHLAPEIDNIEFFYYVNDDPDHAVEEGEWLEEWDMDVEGELPLAVEIRLHIRRKSHTTGLLKGLFTNSDDDWDRVVTYSLIVPLSREMIDLSESEDTTESESGTSDTSTDSTGTT